MASGACCSHDHDCEAASCGEASLHRFVNHVGVTCLNATNANDAPRVLRPWDERRLRVGALESEDDDPELLLHIPFTTDVKLRGIVVSGGGDGSSPTSLRAFINRDDVDFALASELTPVQEWPALVEDPTASVEYATRLSKFQSVSSLTLHFPSNGGAPRTRIYFVGLRGEGSGLTREAPRHIVYEAKPQPQDHKVPGAEGQLRMLGQ